MQDGNWVIHEWGEKVGNENNVEALMQFEEGEKRDWGVSCTLYITIEERMVTEGGKVACRAFQFGIL